MRKRFVLLLSLFGLIAAGSGCSGSAEVPASLERQSATLELIDLLNRDAEVKSALAASLVKASYNGILTLEQYYDYVDSVVTLIPTDRNILPNILEFYYLIDNSPNKLLQKKSDFQQWVIDFANDWGKFLDTPASAKGIETFLNDPTYNMDDYFVGPSGWLTYNQFFAREVKPGARPIDGLRDDTVVVSPADSVPQGHWEIDSRNEVVIKGITASIKGLLANSKYADDFVGGTYMHSFLNVNDYHRLHTSVAGKVLEVRDIPGKIALDVYREPTGKINFRNGNTYQFTQARGLIILESETLGKVAILPIGMAQVSSVTMTAEAGAQLAKGEEFGFFQFGGSDIVMVFQKDKFELIGKVGTHYKQGQAIGKAN